MKGKKRVIVPVLILAAVLLAGGLFAARRAEQERRRELAAVETVEIAGPEELAGLDRFPNLKEIRVVEGEFYDELLAYGQTHPQVTLRYGVDLGGTAADSCAQELSLAPGSFEPARLLEGLRFLPELRRLTLEETELDAQEIRALREAFPDKEIGYTVRLLGSVWPEETKSLDLTALEPGDLEAALRALELLPALERAELTDGEGNNRLGIPELKRLQQARPETLFVYRFDLFGQTVSTEDERIEYVGVGIGNEGAERLREVLPCLSRCRVLLLDQCGLDNEVLAALREEFPQTKIVWRIFLTITNFLTDIKIVHLTWTLTDQNVQVLRFCNEVEYLDVGHNTLTDFSFVRSMPNLKFAILSFNRVSDLSPFSSCKKLEMLELNFCLQLRDISPLAECGNLRLLNISMTHVGDISPAYGLKKLERFYCVMNNDVPEEQKEQIARELPDCWITFEQTISKAVGWSFDAAGGVRAQWYLDMYKILRYRVEPYFFGDYPEEFQNGE